MSRKTMSRDPSGVGYPGRRSSQEEDGSRVTAHREWNRYPNSRTSPGAAVLAIVATIILVFGVLALYGITGAVFGALLTVLFNYAFELGGDPAVVAGVIGAANIIFNVRGWL